MQDAMNLDHPDFRIGVSWRETTIRINPNMIGTYIDKSRKRPTPEIRQLKDFTQKKYEIQKESHQTVSRRNTYPSLSKTYKKLINVAQTNDENELLKQHANKAHSTQEASYAKDIESAQSTPTEMTQNVKSKGVEKEIENDAIINIQKVWKGHQVRKKIEEQYNAAVTIQKTWKDHNDTQKPIASTLGNNIVSTNGAAISGDTVPKSLASLSRQDDLKDEQIKTLQKQTAELSKRVSKQQDPMIDTYHEDASTVNNDTKKEQQTNTNNEPHNSLTEMEIEKNDSVITHDNDNQEEVIISATKQQDPMIDTDCEDASTVNNDIKEEQTNTNDSVVIIHDNQAEVPQNVIVASTNPENSTISATKTNGDLENSSLGETHNDGKAVLSRANPVTQDEKRLSAKIDDANTSQKAATPLPKVVVVINEDQRLMEDKGTASTQLSQSDQVQSTIKDNDKLRNSLTELSLAINIKDKRIQSLEQQNQQLLAATERNNDQTTQVIVDNTANDQALEEEKLDTINLDFIAENADTESEIDTESDSDDGNESKIETEEEESEGFFGYITSFFTPASDDENPYEITEEKLQNVFKQIDDDNSNLIDWNEFQQCAKLLLFTNEDMDLKKAFKQADSDRTGYINYAEFRCAILGQDARKLSVNKLKLMFDRFDKDNSGVLELEEFVIACDMLKFGTLTNDKIDDIPKYFDKVDTDQSGFVDFREFVKAILGRELTGREMRDAHQYALTIKRIKDAFKEMDSDGSGKLNIDEFVKGARKLEVNASEAKLKKLFNKHDINKDGTVELVEFVSLMNRMSVKSDVE